MDVTNTTNTTTTSIKTPEAESETPTRIQPAKPVTVNGLLRRHQPITQPPPFSYAECQKNHAAGMGGHAVDGCGEFMASVSSNPNDPTSLRCAACGCHRNFHRRETNQPTNNNQAMIEYQPAHRYNQPPPPRADSPSSPSPPPISSAYYPASAPHMLLALSSGVSGPQPHSAPHVGHHIPNGKKRFRTKFTHEQKEKMLEFANKIGWKIQRRDEAEIAAFCNEIGVDRNVLKVWMHNNKSTLGKRHRSNENGSSGSEDGGAAAAEDEEEQTQHHHHHHNNVDVNATANAANGTGSSTSS